MGWGRIAACPAAPRLRNGVMPQDLRSFVAAYERAFPGEVVRITEPVSPEYDVMALVLEYERRRRFPLLFFERVTGSDIPIIANVVASRRALAFAAWPLRRRRSGVFSLHFPLLIE